MYASVNAKVLIIFSFCTLCLAACSEKLPEAYGVYIHDGGKYYPISENENLPNNISSKAEILIFDKAVHDMSVEDLSKTIHTRVDIRAGIEAIEPGDLESLFRPKSKYAWSQASEDIKVSPVKGEEDMIRLSRVGGFQKNAYILVMPNGNYPFNIYDAVAPCDDQIYYVKSKYELQAFEGLGQPRTAFGNLLLKKDFRPCSETHIPEDTIKESMSSSDVPMQ